MRELVIHIHLFGKAVDQGERGSIVSKKRKREKGYA